MVLAADLGKYSILSIPAAQMFDEMWSSNSPTAAAFHASRIASMDLAVHESRIRLQHSWPQLADIPLRPTPCLSFGCCPMLQLNDTSYMHTSNSARLDGKFGTVVVGFLQNNSSAQIPVSCQEGVYVTTSMEWQMLVRGSCWSLPSTQGGIDSNLLWLELGAGQLMCFSPEGSYRISSSTPAIAQEGLGQMLKRYDTDFTPAYSIGLICYLASEKHGIQRVSGELICQCLVLFWLFSVPVLVKAPWSPIILIEIKGNAVHLRPVPWPFLLRYRNKISVSTEGADLVVIAEACTWAMGMHSVIYLQDAGASKLSRCLAVHRLDILPLPWPEDSCEMIVDSDMAAYGTFVLSDCKCIGQADASVTQMFWIHPPQLQLLVVRSKSFAEIWLQSIIATSSNLFFKLGTLKVLIVQLKADVGKLQTHDNAKLVIQINIGLLKFLLAEMISRWASEFHVLRSEYCSTILKHLIFMFPKMMENSSVKHGQQLCIKGATIIVNDEMPPIELLRTRCQRSGLDFAFWSQGDTSCYGNAPSSVLVLECYHICSKLQFYNLMIEDP